MKARAIELGGAKLLFTNTANAELKLPGGGRGGKGLHPCALCPVFACGIWMGYTLIAQST